MSAFVPPPKQHAMEPSKDYGDVMTPERDSKRRKIRKGTTSCWHCKKRKVKCTFDETSDTECIACRRRGAPCVSQEQPDEEFKNHAESNHDLLLDRMQRVETLLEQLIKVNHVANKTVPLAEPGYLTPTSEQQPSDVLPESCPDVPVTSVSTVEMTDEERKLSEELIKAFPSQADIDIIWKSNYTATFYCHQIFTKSHDRPEHEAYEFVNNLAKIPNPSTTPPVLVAKKMIIFALSLQYFQTQHTRGLTESPLTVMNRLVDVTMRLATTNEKIVTCIEGLECIILEGVFQSNGGNLRRAWLAFRKAMVIAQLMKLDLPNPPLVKSHEADPKVNPKFMWFRIIYMDSYLSLMLGLPYGGQDTNMESQMPGEPPSCKLERVHTLVARRIIDRNRRESFQDFTTTRNLDLELLHAAKALPDKFWNQPNFAALEPNSREAFWETMRLCDQLHHYNLVHLLHLPYLLRYDKDSSDLAYSQFTCVYASRQIVSRFVALRNLNRSMVSIYCRTSDFFALMACTTILLTHIDGHRLGEQNWRAHTRLDDHAIVEQFLQSLEMAAEHTDDELTTKGAAQLRRLLKVEADAARGMEYTAHNTLCSIEEQSGELQLSIPYYGIVNIGREGIRKNDEKMSSFPVLAAHVPDSVHVANHLFSAAGFGDILHQEEVPGPFLPLSDVQIGEGTEIDLEGTAASAGDVYEQQLQYPALAASVHDWAFQGVDAAFFDNVMRGTDNWGQTL
ncbi:hypothetical protein GQ44DRAFT_696913 [Phaeosphaeriaceae sp. PMI808]|nr:hypothetical protein GQ44DRAFT_696913 [Phaeosphaeriaceae sp. PMI808]